MSIELYPVSKLYLKKYICITESKKLIKELKIIERLIPLYDMGIDEKKIKELKIELCTLIKPSNYELTNK